VSDQLDLLLDATREPEPFDDAFVASVMTQVNADETRRQAKLARRGIRRPMVMGVVAAIVVTGGAVAAVVGTNPLHRDEAVSTKRPAVTITAEESDEPAAAPRASAKQAVPSVASPAKTKVPTGEGYLGEHTSYIVDAATGLLLQTETYSTTFVIGQAQRITLTLENTGRHPIAFNATDGCPLQVMAYGDENTTPESLITDPDGRFEWECAGSDDDPTIAKFGDTFILQPGERKVADAYVTLPSKGTWSVAGMCRCEYRKVEPTPVPKSDPLTDLTRRALPSPLLPDQPDGKNLVAPPIAVRAD
jgi:hypothetical protein